MKDLRKKVLSQAVTCCVFAMVSGIGFAAEAGTTTLDTIEVNTKHVKDVDKTVIKNSAMTYEMVSNERDLVRNQVGVEMTEGGRAGFDGFSMRGVDQDRVAINVDGIPMTESFQPVFYERHGFLNGTRNSIEFENMSLVDIHKGSNSVIAGSGALGGSVEYRTKAVEDFVMPGKNFGAYTKVGYTSNNEGRLAVAGAGWHWHGIEGLLQVTHRHQHELKNYDMADDGRYLLMDNNGRYKTKPDPMNFESLAVMAKLGYRFNDRHYANVFFDDYKQRRFDDYQSYILKTPTTAKDTNPSRRFGFEYRYTPEATKVEELMLRLIGQNSRQQTYIDQKNVGGFSPFAKRYRLVEQRQRLALLDVHFRPVLLGKTVHQVHAGTGFRVLRFDNHNYDIDGNNHRKDFRMVEPAKTKSEFLYLTDTIGFNEHWVSEVGARFEHATYTRFDDDAHLHQSKNTDGHHRTDGPGLRRYNVLAGNVGIAYLFKPKTFVQYRFSRGYRLPTIDEVFFYMNNNDIIRQASHDLKPEYSSSHQLTFAHSGSGINFEATAYHTDYKNYIDYEVSPMVVDELYYFSRGALFLRKNKGHAEVNGIELKTQILGNVVGLPKQWFGTFKAAYMHGKRDDEGSLLTLQPLQFHLDVGYQNEKWKVALMTRYYGPSKQNLKIQRVSKMLDYEVDEHGKPKNVVSLYQDVKYSSKRYFVADLVAQYKMNKNFTLNAGIFNLFNQKYVSWENLRQINYKGIQGDAMYDGHGTERYTAPGRNYAITLEGRF